MAARVPVHVGVLRADIRSVKSAPATPPDALRSAFSRPEAVSAERPSGKAWSSCAKKGRRSQSQIGPFVSLVDLASVRQAQFIREAIESVCLADAVVEPSGIAGLHEILQSQWPPRLRRYRPVLPVRMKTYAASCCRWRTTKRTWTAVDSAKAHLDRARRLSLIDAGHVPRLNK